MLPSFLRFPLRKNSQFFSEAQSVNERHLRVLYSPLSQNAAQDSSSKESGLQLAIIVPKRHGNAVERVKTKRLIRSAINELQKAQSPVFALPYSVVVYVKGQHQDYAQYKQELASALAHLASKVQ